MQNAPRAPIFKIKGNALLINCRKDETHAEVGRNIYAHILVFQFEVRLEGRGGGDLVLDLGPGCDRRLSPAGGAAAFIKVVPLSRVRFVKIVTGRGGAGRARGVMDCSTSNSVSATGAPGRPRPPRYSNRDHRVAGRGGSRCNGPPLFF